MFIFFDCGTENETSQEFNFTSMVRSTMDFAMFLALFSTNLKNEIVHIIPYNWFYIVYQVSYFFLMGLSDTDFVFFFFFFCPSRNFVYIYTRFCSVPFPSFLLLLHFSSSTAFRFVFISSCYLLAG